MFLDLVGVRGTGIVSTAPSQLGCQANGENSHRHNPIPPPNFMPDALPVATLAVYLGLLPALGSGFCLVTFGSPMAWFS